MKEKKEKTCEHCGVQFRTSFGFQRWCGKRCMETAKRQDFYPLSAVRKFGIPTGTVGAIGELSVCIDLMQRGYSVFRAVSPACQCDLVAYRGDDPPLRIEVRTAYEQNGKIAWPRADASRFDVLAAALPERVVYAPPIDGEADG